MIPISAARQTEQLLLPQPIQILSLSLPLRYEPDLSTQ